MAGLISCNFCRIFNQSAGLREDVILYEEPDLMVLADFAPVNFGHILILPRDHVLSYAELDPEQLVKLRRVQEFTEAALRRLGRHVIWGEHGTGSDLQTSACCGHAHLHGIPVHSARFAKAVQNAYFHIDPYPAILTNLDAIHLMNSGESYVTLQIGGQIMAWTHDGKFPNQMLRGAVSLSFLDTQDRRLPFDDKSEYCYRLCQNPDQANLLGALWQQMKAIPPHGLSVPGR